MLSRFLRYIDKIFDFNNKLSGITACRFFPRIDIETILKSAIAVFTTGRGSLNSMEMELRLPKSINRLPSADTISRVVSKINSDELRDLHYSNCYRLKRNKLLSGSMPLALLGVDGHEFFSL